MSIYTDNIQDMLADDSKIAIRQLESDAMAGNLEATYLLGKVYYDGVYYPPNSNKVLGLWEKGAQNGSIDCLRALGDCHFFGFGYEESNEKAMEIYNEVLRKSPNVIKHYARLVVCTVTAGVLPKTYLMLSLF